MHRAQRDPGTVEEFIYRGEYIRNRSEWGKIAKQANDGATSGPSLSGFATAISPGDRKR